MSDNSVFLGGAEFNSKNGESKSSKGGYVYILTNPSFPNYVKIGYADDVEKRIKELNRSECTPFAFRVYATYKVDVRLSDMKIHDVIDKLNPNLRSIDDVNGKRRVREFYCMPPEDAYSLFEAIAEINNLESNLKLWEPTKKEEDEQQVAEEIEQLSKNRHHFKALEFSSSLTGKKYKGFPGDDGNLKIIELDTGIEIPNNAKPSKKAIVKQAVLDYGGTIAPNEDTSYQLYHKLMKLSKRA